MRRNRLKKAAHWGERNEPAFVCEVLERVAEVRGEGVGTLAEVTSQNAARLFGLARSE